MGDYESFFEAVNELGWKHVSIRNDESKVRLYKTIHIFAPLFSFLLLGHLAVDWRCPRQAIFSAEVLHLVEDLPLVGRALSHNLQFGKGFVYLYKRGQCYFSGAKKDNSIVLGDGKQISEASI